MKKSILATIFICSTLGYAQSKPVTIVGNMPQLYGGDYISFSKPLGKFSFAFEYINSNDNAVLNNGKFVKTINLSVPGIIEVYEKPFNSIRTTSFFAAPGDTIVMERQNTEVVFKGKNAIISEMYNNRNIIPTESSDIIDIFKTNANAEKIIEQVNKKKQEYCEKYNAFYEKKDITKTCLDYVTLLISQSVDRSMLNIAIYDDIRESEKITLAKEEIDKIANYINPKP